MTKRQGKCFITISAGQLTIITREILSLEMLKNSRSHLLCLRELVRLLTCFNFFALYVSWKPSLALFSGAKRKTLKQAKTVINNKRDTRGRKKATERIKLFSIYSRNCAIFARAKMQKRLKSNARARVSRDLVHLSRADIHWH